MSEQSVVCPKCKSPHGYLDRDLWTCPECFHEWQQPESSDEAQLESSLNASFKDANGVELHDGDTVSTVKDLSLGKAKIRAGTKVKGIRLLEQPVNGHDISCKIPGHGSMYLKCSVVKKI